MDQLCLASISRKAFNPHGRAEQNTSAEHNTGLLTEVHPCWEQDEWPPHALMLEGRKWMGEEERQKEEQKEERNRVRCCFDPAFGHAQGGVRREEEGNRNRHRRRKCVLASQVEHSHTSISASPPHQFQLHRDCSGYATSSRRATLF